MLEALGSGLRAFRTTIVAGAVWLVALVIAVRPYADDAGPGLKGVADALAALQPAAPDVLPVVGLILAAYVLGVVSEGILGSAGRSLSRLVLRIQRKGVHPLATNEIGTIDSFLESAQGRSRAHFGSDPEKVRRARFEVREKAPALDRQVVVLQEEAAFRLQLLPPLLALAVAVGIHVPWALDLVLAAVTVGTLGVVAASANHCAERANDLLADWKLAGSPVLSISANEDD